MDTVIKINYVFLGIVCLVAFVVSIATAAIACIEFLQKYIDYRIAIFVVMVVAIELFIFGICFAEYLIGGRKWLG